jgi:hypothetical protein
MDTSKYLKYFNFISNQGNKIEARMKYQDLST